MSYKLHFKNKPDPMYKDSKDLYLRIHKMIKVLTKNRLKVLYILPFDQNDAMRFKYIKNESKIDSKNLQQVIKDLLEIGLIEAATGCYQRGYKDGEERWIESHPHYHLSHLGYALKMVFANLMFLFNAYPFKFRNTGIFTHQEVLCDYYHDKELDIYNFLIQESENLFPKDEEVSGELAEKIIEHLDNPKI